MGNINSDIDINIDIDIDIASTTILRGKEGLLSGGTVGHVY